MKLKSLEPDDVLPFLRRNLRWRILDVSIPTFCMSLGVPVLLFCLMLNPFSLSTP
jgi:hypothetical protein